MSKTRRRWSFLLISFGSVLFLGIQFIYISWNRIAAISTVEDGTAKSSPIRFYGKGIINFSTRFSYDLPTVEERLFRYPTSLAAEVTVFLNAFIPPEDNLIEGTTFNNSLHILADQIKQIDENSAGKTAQQWDVPT
jgi:hypothetical protein